MFLVLVEMLLTVVVFNPCQRDRYRRGHLRVGIFVSDTLTCSGSNTCNMQHNKRVGASRVVH